MLAITALGLYECEINGQLVGDEVFAPGWTDYRRRVQYQTYDVLHFLNAGENVLGVILGDGWYCGFVGWSGRQTYGDRPRLLVQLELLFEDNSSLTVASNESWRTLPGPILESDLLMGETYDARLDLGQWSQPGYDDSHWQKVVINPPAIQSELCPRVGPPVRKIEELQPLVGDRGEPSSKSYRQYDFGQNFAGRVRLKVKAPRGTVLKVRFAEILTPAGRLYLENLRGARATDCYICKGGDEEEWEPRFTFHGFRYVEVTGLKPEDSCAVTGVVLHTDLTATGSFRCSNPLLNQLQHNIVWGQKSNFLEAPTDCPQRDERLGWTGDAQVFIRTACFNMDVLHFFHKWMRDMRDAQTAKGGIPAVIPSVTLSSSAAEDGGPAWSDAIILCPWTLYLCYGDLLILEENYQAMQRFMEFIAKERCVGRIRSHPEADSWGGFGDWLALDGSASWEGLTSRPLIGTAFYAYVASVMSQVAERLDKPEDAASYRGLHQEIVQAFRDRFVTPEGLLVSETQTAYVLALHFDLLPAEIRPAAAKELVRLIEKRDWHLATGFVGTPYLLEVLEKTGYLEVAYKLLEQETYPSWLFPVKHGATTIWERWDGWTPEKGFQDKAMNSFNHYAYGAVGAWMYRSVAGLELDPENPGYRRIMFRPRPGGSLTWAEARLETPFGLASIRWEWEADSLRLELEVPDGCSASLNCPEGYSANETEFGPGRRVFTLARSGGKTDSGER